MLATVTMLAELSTKSLKSYSLDAVYDPDLDIRVTSSEMESLRKKCSWCQEQLARMNALIIYPTTNFNVGFLLSTVRLEGDKLLGITNPGKELVRLNDASIICLDTETSRYSVYNDRY